MDLTERQIQVVEAIRAWVARYGYPPSTRDLASELGVTSTSVVHDHLVRLRRMGVIEWEPNRARTLRVVANG